MANNQDRPQVWRSYGTGTGGYRRLEPMNERELAAREALQQPYNAMLARQQAYEAKLQPTSEPTPAPVVGCVFAKSCNLPDTIISYNNPSGYIPLERLADYGEHAVLGGRETDATGRLPLQKISATVLPAGLGSLALAGSAITGTAAATGTVATGFMLGLVALLWPSTLGDSALYSDEQLRSLPRARTRVRLNIEQQADGSLKGYAFYTGNNRDWEMVDVVQFQLQGTQHVVDLGDGIELIWTPAVDPADTIGIPALEAAPATPHIWVYPPTETAASIIVDPIYPPEYKDFILVFPAESGIRPLYVVLNIRPGDHAYHPAPELLPAYPDAKVVARKTPVKGGGALRKRWKTAKGLILEWDLQHGAIEMYDARGRHIGEFDHITGNPTSTKKSKKEKERRIEP